MKKLIIGVFVLLLALTLLLLIYLKRPVILGDSVAASLVPGDTVALLQLTDLPRSKERWKQTALYQISQEPEVQAFLEKPESKVTGHQHLEDDWNKFRELDPKEAFVAVTAITDKAPKFVAGFDYKGKKGDAEALAADCKEKLKREYPAGKSDIVKYESVEIETFEFDGMVVASTFKTHWFFVSDDLDLLKATLDRLAGKAGAGDPLRDNAAYKSTLAKLPPESDVLLYVQPQTIFDRLATLIAVSNPNMDPKQLDEWKKIEALSAGMKFDGEKIRDAIYIKVPSKGGEPPMARNSLAVTSPDTMFYFATMLHLGAAPHLPDPSLDTTGIVTVLGFFLQALQQQGLTYDDFKTSFGPEFGLVVDWPDGVLQPSPLLSLDVRDPAKAAKFVDALTGGTAGFSPWAKQVIEGVPYYALPQESAGIVTVNPVLALTDKSVLFGLSLDSVQQAVKNGKSAGAKLDKSGGFQASAALVAKPTGSFGYVDSKALFEKIYSLASVPLKMMGAFNPHASEYADLGKLPSTGAISKHLSPIVYSQSTDAEGLLVESVGPVTFNQAVFVLAAGAGAAAVPVLNKQGYGLGQPPAPATVPAPAAAATP